MILLAHTSYLFAQCRIGTYPEDQQDTEHIIIDAALANEGMLHRFTNAGGAECSAIYRGGTEVWWHYREREAQMIRDWNKEYAHD